MASKNYKLRWIHKLKKICNKPKVSIESRLDTDSAVEKWFIWIYNDFEADPVFAVGFGNSFDEALNSVKSELETRRGVTIQ